MLPTLLGRRPCSAVAQGRGRTRLLGRPHKQRGSGPPWALPRPAASPAARPKPALRSDGPPGSKTQLPRLSNNVFSSQMKTCPKHGPGSLSGSLLPLERAVPGHSCMADNSIYKAVLLPGSFEK